MTFTFYDADVDSLTILSIDQYGNQSPLANLDGGGSYQVNGPVGSYYVIDGSNGCLTIVSENGAGKATIR